ncbi:hypothetical protein C8R44DRAFT_978088 [Mycena epipterygia]|nr:hypothetical protein C8R44DRAFT_978088 [Mycena epipterygia]
MDRQDAQDMLSLIPKEPQSSAPASPPSTPPRRPPHMLMGDDCAERWPVCLREEVALTAHETLWSSIHGSDMQEMWATMSSKGVCHVRCVLPTLFTALQVAGPTCISTPPTCSAPFRKHARNINKYEGGCTGRVNPETLERCCRVIRATTIEITVLKPPLLLLPVEDALFDSNSSSSPPRLSADSHVDYAWTKYLASQSIWYTLPLFFLAILFVSQTSPFSSMRKYARRLAACTRFTRSPRRLVSPRRSWHTRQYSAYHFRPPFPHSDVSPLVIPPPYCVSSAPTASPSPTT